MIIREARSGDAAAIARVHIDTWNTTYSGILPSEYIARQSYEKRKSHWKNCLTISTEKETNYFIYVAENPDREIVGFVDGGLERSNNSVDRGEIYALYILAAYQRQGVGRNLVRQIAFQLYQSGLTSILIWVLEDNPAVEFYQALGGQKITQKLIKTNGVDFTEIAYGWNDAKILIAK